MDKELLYMQKLSGIITESEYQQKLEEISLKGAIAGAMMTLATMLPKTADAQDGRVEWETVKDTVEMISMDQDRDTIRKITTTAYEIFKNRKGDVKKVVADIKTEFTQPNSWDIDSIKTSTEQERTAKDPQTGKMITWTTDGELEIDGRWMKSPKMMIKIVAGITDPEDRAEAEIKLERYIKEYNRLKKLVR